MEDHRVILALATAHTQAVVAAAGEELWDRPAAEGVPTLRDQLRHLVLVRESILRCLAGEPTAGLGATFETEAWVRGGAADLGPAFAAHGERCRDLLERTLVRDLDAPFVTPFGTPSTPRNYLRTMLLEETHHRAQMTQLLRFFGVEPPPYPGEAWTTLGL